MGSIRAVDIQFILCNALDLVGDYDGVFVVRACIGEDIGEYDNVLFLAQRRKLFVKKGPRADVLQTDGIQHSGGGFEQSRRRITSHRFLGETLNDESAKLVEVDDVFE